MVNCDFFTLIMNQIYKSRYCQRYRILLWVVSTMDLFFQLFVHLFRRFPTYNWWLLWQNSLFWTVFELEEIICLKFINIHLATHCQPMTEQSAHKVDLSTKCSCLSRHQCKSELTLDSKWNYNHWEWKTWKVFSKEFSRIHLEPFQIKPGDVIKLNSISATSSPLIPPTGKLNIFQCYRAQWGFFCSFIALSLVQTVAIFRGYIFFVSLC